MNGQVPKITTPGHDRTGDAARMRQAVQGPVRVDRAPGALGGETAAWLGERVSDARPGLRSFRCEFEIDARTGTDRARHVPALVTLGEIASSDVGWTMAVEWRPGDATADLPVFTGRLNVGPGRLELVGYYTPPGGHRRTSDVAPLDTATEAAGRWFLRRVASVL